MARIAVPNGSEPIGECPHCGRKVYINKTWLQRLTEIINAINTLNEAP